jgi:hypothetical protein
MAFDVVLNKKYTIVAEHLLNKAIHWVIMSGFEANDHRCNSCRKIFTLDDKKLNGSYYKTCRSCRDRKCITKNVNERYHECRSCRRSFSQKEDEKTCSTCLAKKTKKSKCIKCDTPIEYLLGKLHCNKCLEHIEKYKSQLIRESEECRSRILDDDDYESNKLKYIESQIHLLYYSNNITGDLTQNLRRSSVVIMHNINIYLRDSQISWKNIRLKFIKPSCLFKDPTDFPSYDNIGIEVIDGR